jgi:hypothetical protein
MASLQVVMLGAPTSLASTTVIGPHHAAVTHVGGSSEVGQREHMFRSARVHREVLVCFYYERQVFITECYVGRLRVRVRNFRSAIPAFMV